MYNGGSSQPYPRRFNMSYSIIKFAKIKSISEISEYAGHNLRTKISKTRNENIDLQRTPKNRRLVNTFNAKKTEDLQKSITAHFKKLGVKVRKDSVLAIDLIATTSPEYWGDWHDQIGTPQFEKKLKVWEDIQLKQAQKEYGAENVVFAECHLDETTPHIHFLVLPLEKKDVIYKNRHGTSIKNKVVLNANKYNPEFYTGLVTRFAEANSSLGLQRGNFNSVVDPTPLKDYRNQLKKEILKQKKITDSYISAITGAQGQAQMIKQLANENYALKRENAGLQAQLAVSKGGDLSDEALDALGM